MATRRYPMPGTNADRILAVITVQPGISVSGLVNALKMNPSPTRVCLKALTKHGLIEDRPDNNGHHHYHVANILV